MVERHSIYALSSGAGMAAVALVRVSGPAAGLALQKIAGSRPAARRAGLRQLIDPGTGEVIDEALVLWFPGPNTFSGEDCCEFHVHGSRAVVQKLLDVLLSIPGCRPAEAGEFTRRAFENGKLDLMEVEGLADLISAQTEEQRKQAWFHKSGAASDVFLEWREQLIRALANIEAAIDFSDEEGVEAAALNAVTGQVEMIREAVRRELTGQRRGTAIREGVRVVLAGPPNVGKSSLLNRLAERDAAIVSDIAGTTRDTIEVQLDLDGVPVVLVDTAGLRANSDDAIERLGIDRSRSQLTSADLILWMGDPEHGFDSLPESFDSNTLRILNKSDSAGSSELPAYDLAVSALTGAGLDDLIELVSVRVNQAFQRMEPALVTRQRHRAALENCLEHLDSDPGQPLELRAESLRLAVRSLERLVGRIDVEDLLDVIFKDFCIGK